MPLISLEIAAEDEGVKAIISWEGCTEREEEKDRTLGNSYSSELENSRDRKGTLKGGEIGIFIEAKKDENTKESEPIEYNFK